jgi:diguanylate cyclase (GGDEF)-like protein
MKHKILSLGRMNFIILLTLVSCVLAILLDIIIAELLDHKISWSEDLVRAAIIPSLMAPGLSWFLIGLLFELNDLHEKTNRLATFDGLTNLFNRRAFIQSCESLHHLAERNKRPYCFFVLDIDFFKNINDAHGHPCGDEVLATLGQLLKDNSRKSDVIGRLGGEEFGFFLPDTDKLQATEYAQKLQNKINALEINYENKTINITVSIGIAINLFDENLSLEEIYKRADKALYSAKNNDRNQFTFYT